MIPLEPRGQMRARATARGGRAWVYKHEKQEAAEDLFLVYANRHRPSEPWDGPLALGIRLYVPIPQSKSKSWRESAMKGHVRPTGRPDLSNYIKLAEDCMNEVFWKDDAQIVEYLPGTGKWYGEPRWEIQIVSLPSNQRPK